MTSLAAGAGGGCPSATCTLNDALTAANALAASPGDDISVVFDPALTGTILYTAADPRMTNTVPNAVAVQVAGVGGGTGAVFWINANRPLTLDLGNKVSLDHDPANAAITSMLLIASNNVTVQNFNFGNGIDSSATGIVVGTAAQNTVVRNGLSKTYQANGGLDYCIALVDGANTVSVTNYTCDGANASGFVTDQPQAPALGVSNITLTNVQFKNITAGATGGEIMVSPGPAGSVAANDAKVTNFVVSNSTFTSPATGVSNSILFRYSSNISGFTVKDSTFTGVGTRAVYVEDGPDLGAGFFRDPVSTTNLTVKNNTFTNTAEMIRLFAIAPDGNLVYATHTGLTIQNNTIDGATCSTNICGLIHLSGSPGNTVYNNTLIENNQLLNQQNSANGAGIYIHSGGANNIIRSNTFNGDVTNATPKTLHAIFSDALGNPTATQSGWTLQTNNILNYQSGKAPILLASTTNTVVFGNTFGIGTTGSAAPSTDPETTSNMFMANELGANFNIQTWRPTKAQYGGGAVTLTVAPVNPAAGGNSTNQPAADVSIDVYYTATDKAEKYLGRIPGSYLAANAPLTYTFTSAGVGAGAVRTQVTEAASSAAARSSQYSAAVTMTPDLGLVARGVGAGSMGGGLLALFAGLALLRRRMLAPLFGVLALTATMSANAADRDWTDKLYGGANFGYLKTDFDAQGLKSHLNAKPGYGVTDVQVDHNGIGGGLWLGYALNPNWGVELAWTTGADEQVRFAGSVPSLDQAVKDASPDLIGYGDAYQLRLRYNHALSKDWVLSPHAGIGLTWTNQSFESGATGQKATLDDVSFSYNVGGSINYVITRDWSVGLSGDFHQVPGNGMFGLVAAVVEWRMPRAFGF